MLLPLLLLFIGGHSQAQDSLTGNWTLQGAIAHARTNNLDVRQSEVVARGSEYFLRQSQLSQLPSISFNSSYGRSYGTNIDPATNDYTTQSYDYFTFSGTASFLVFGWFQKHNTILKNKYALKAAQADLSQARDVVTWTVTTSFLRVLICWEQMKINEKQVQTTQSQISQASKFVKAGALPDLSLAQLQAQLAGDSASMIKSQSELNAAVVDMKALLNLPQNAAFNVLPPDADELAKAEVLLADPETIYDVAEKRMGAVQSVGLRLQAAKYELAATKGALLPQLSFNAQFGTAYSTSIRNSTIVGYSTEEVPNAYVSNGGARMPLYQEHPIYSIQPVSFRDQLRSLYRNTYFLNLTLPVFNGWAANYNVRKARINYEEQQLAQDEVRLKLRQEVYKAHNDARNALQTYIAAKRAAAAIQRALNYAQARLFVGMTNVTDYLSILNNSYIAQSRLLSAKYDMFFKMKLVDFYMGKELRL